MNSSIAAGSGIRAGASTSSGNDLLNEAEALGTLQKKSLQIWLWMALVLPLLSMVPLFYEQSKGIFAQRTYLFFPLATAFGAWLLYRTCDYRLASLRRGRIALGIACLGMGMAILGIYFFSPWMVQVSAVVVVFGWSLGAFGGSSWTRVAAICSLFAVSVPLPSGRDMQLSAGLQSIASWISNGFLDAISVPNIVETVTLQVQDKKIPVAEVCGGADSVFALFAFGLAIVVARRSSLVVSLVTLLSVPFFSVFGNVLRLLAIAIGFEYLEMDLSTGTAHIITAVVVFAISVACLSLLHISAQAILDPISAGNDANNLTKLYQWVAGWPQVHEESLSVATRWRVSFKSLVAPCLACIVLGTLSAYAVFSSEIVNTSLFGISEEQASTLNSKSVFPDQFGSLRLTSYAPITNSSGKSVGKYSHRWTFDDKGNQVFATLDFPFNGWRPVWLGYQSTGWKIIDTKPVDVPPERGGEAWTVEEFRMQNQYGLFGFVWYAFFDENGVPTKRVNEMVGSNRISLLKRLQKSSGEKVPTSFQVQLILESGRDLSELEIANNRQVFFEVFERIRQQTEAVLKKAR